MTALSLAESHTKPLMVGRIYDADQLPYEISQRDFEADIIWSEAMLGRMGITAGQTILLGFQSSQGAQWGPWIEALNRRRATFGLAMPTIYDGPRWGMYLRRFDLGGVAGINAKVLQALSDVGENAPTLFKKSGVLLADPDAVPTLKKWGLRPWRMINLGPTFALQSPDDNDAVYNAAEWLLENVDGQIVISSRPGRLCKIERLATGLRGKVAVDAYEEPRLRLED